MKKERVIRYKGEKIIVLFSVDRCTHVAECLRGAPDVFNTQRTPWVLPDADSADRVAEVVESCPTGSLHYRRLDGGKEETPPATNTVTVEAAGPLTIHGDILLKSSDGTELKETRIGLCRCGASAFKPICDGAHDDFDFKDNGIVHQDEAEKPSQDSSGPLQVKFIKNGPMILNGSMTLVDAEEHQFVLNKAVLCRCGASKRMPFCDGSHAHAGFEAE
jgi:CDGSH-type Zn-finger protein/uncharacterized Fe-S cluster protein YjdI